MRNIISSLLFGGIAAGIFFGMYKIQTSDDLNIKDLNKIVQEEIQQVKELKRKHIDSH